MAARSGIRGGSPALSGSGIAVEMERPGREACEGERPGWEACDGRSQNRVGAPPHPVGLGRVHPAPTPQIWGETDSGSHEGEVPGGTTTFLLPIRHAMWA